MKYKHYDLDIPADDPFAYCKLGRKTNAEVLTQIVQNYADGFILSINGEWGTGKTTFMKMWAAYLKLQHINTLYFNAWENDFISDPMVALLGELRQLTTTRTKETLASILDIGSRIAVNAIPALAKGIVKHYCGEDLADAVKDALNAGSEIFKTEILEYETKKDKLKTFKEKLSTYIQETNPDHPLVFIVDELDRCRPDYAVEVLERIKHFFSIKGIVFVLSIDKEQLCNSIRGRYGSDRINAEDYLRRFIDVEYLLPKPDIKSYCQYLYEYFEFDSFLETEDRKRHRDFSSDGDQLLRCAQEIAEGKNLSLRQIEKIFAHTRLVLRACQSDYYIFPRATFILVCIRAIDLDFYLKIINRQLTIQELSDYVPNVFPERMFIDQYSDTTIKIHKSIFYGLAELFYCYDRSFDTYSSQLTIQDTNSKENKLTFKIPDVDEKEFLDAIIRCRHFYRGITWTHNIKSIDLLNYIVD